MNKFKNNKQFYKSTFDDIHASDELLRKVQAMNKEKTNKKTHAVRKVIYIVAAAAILLVASNAVVYAATGESLFETILVVTVDDQSNEIVKTDLVGDDKVKYSESVDENGKKSISVSSDGENFESDAVGDANLVSKDGRVYLEIADLNYSSDITDDLADGKAEVKVKDADNKEHTVKITGNTESYTIEYDWFLNALSRAQILCSAFNLDRL